MKFEFLDSMNPFRQELDVEPSSESSRGAARVIQFTGVRQSAAGARDRGEMSDQRSSSTASPGEEDAAQLMIRVSAGEVAAIRAATRARTTPWTVRELMTATVTATEK